MTDVTQTVAQAVTAVKADIVELRAESISLDVRATLLETATAPLPTISFSVGTLSVAEGDAAGKSVTITAKRSNTSGSLDVVASYVSGSMLAGDFLGGALPGARSFHWADGSDTAIATVDILGNTDVNANKTFGYTFAQAPVGYALGSPATITITVTDDDVAAQPKLTLTGITAFDTAAPARTVVASINNVPAGVTPAVTVAGNRLVAEQVSGAWKVVVAAGATQVEGALSFSVSAAGAVSASGSVTVTAPSYGFRAAWIDFNGNGIESPFTASDSTVRKLQMREVALVAQNGSIIPQGANTESCPDGTGELGLLFDGDLTDLVGLNLSTATDFALRWAADYGSGVRKNPYKIRIYRNNDNPQFAPIAGAIYATNNPSKLFNRAQAVKIAEIPAGTTQSSYDATGYIELTVINAGAINAGAEVADNSVASIQSIYPQPTSTGYAIHFDATQRSAADRDLEVRSRVGGSGGAWTAWESVENYDRLGSRCIGHTVTRRSLSQLPANALIEVEVRQQNAAADVVAATRSMTMFAMPANLPATRQGMNVAFRGWPGMQETADLACAGQCRVRVENGPKSFELPITLGYDTPGAASALVPSAQFGDQRNGILTKCPSTLIFKQWTFRATPNKHLPGAFTYVGDETYPAGYWNFGSGLTALSGATFFDADNNPAGLQGYMRLSGSWRWRMVQMERDAGQVPRRDFKLAIKNGGLEIWEGVPGQSGSTLLKTIANASTNANQVVAGDGSVISMADYAASTAVAQCVTSDLGDGSKDIYLRPAGGTGTVDLYNFAVILGGYAITRLSYSLYDVCAEPGAHTLTVPSWASGDCESVNFTGGTTAIDVQRAPAAIDARRINFNVTPGAAFASPLIFSLRRNDEPNGLASRSYVADRVSISSKVLRNLNWTDSNFPTSSYYGAADLDLSANTMAGEGFNLRLAVDAANRAGGDLQFVMGPHWGLDAWQKAMTYIRDNLTGVCHAEGVNEPNNSTFSAYFVMGRLGVRAGLATDPNDAVVKFYTSQMVARADAARAIFSGAAASRLVVHTNLGVSPAEWMTVNNLGAKVDAMALSTYSGPLLYTPAGGVTWDTDTWLEQQGHPTGDALTTSLIRLYGMGMRSSARYIMARIAYCQANFPSVRVAQYETGWHLYQSAGTPSPYAITGAYAVKKDDRFIPINLEQLKTTKACFGGNACYFDEQPIGDNPAVWVFGNRIDRQAGVKSPVFKAFQQFAAA